MYLAFYAHFSSFQDDICVLGKAHMRSSSPFQERSSNTSSFQASLLQMIDDVMSLALCLQVVSQAPQHFRSSEKQAACEGCFACQSVCSVISLHPSTSGAAHPHEFSKVDVSHRRGHSSLGFPFHFSLSCSKPTESVCPVNHDGYIRVIVTSYMTPQLLFVREQ